MPDATQKQPPLEAIQRLMLRLIQEGDCWIWTGGITSAGRGADYGAIKIQGTVFRTHRVSYAAFVGPIPPGITVEHECRRTLCCNPRHLSLLTVAENSSQSNIDNPRGFQLPEYMNQENLGF